MHILCNTGQLWVVSCPFSYNKALLCFISCIFYSPINIHSNLQGSTTCQLNRAPLFFPIKGQCNWSCQCHVSWETGNYGVALISPGAPQVCYRLASVVPQPPQDVHSFFSLQIPKTANTEAPLKVKRGQIYFNLVE